MPHLSMEEKHANLMVINILNECVPMIDFKVYEHMKSVKTIFNKGAKRVTKNGVL